MTCFDDAVAAGIVLRTLTTPEREAHMSHAETCDACLARLAHATRGLVSRGPDGIEAAEPERPGGVFAGRYVLLDTLGHGGMGVVYLAHDTVLGREVALKVVRAAAGHTTELLRVEARALAAIDHPNVVRVYDLATDSDAAAGDRLAVAMERVRGTTLRQRLRRPMPRRTLVNALLGVSEGLAAAHAAHVVHGDVKLDNVLVDRDNHVRIADFGLSRLVGAAPSIAGGTALFMAPELAHDPRPSPASDQYALAACWVDALGGERPTDSAGWAPIARRARPLWARKPLARALAPTPEARFDDVRALLTSLRRRRAAFAAALVGLALALCGGPWLALALDRGATQAACVDAATTGLPLALPQPDLEGRPAIATLWARGVFAYAAWRVRWTDLQRAICAAPLATDQACLGVERRWMERSLRGLDPTQPQQQSSVVQIAAIEFIASERLCDDPRERDTITRFEAASAAAMLADLGATLTLAIGNRASITELDAVVAALGPDRPSRLLALALVARATVLQQMRQVDAALADAELAMEVAARLRRRELQSLAATMLGAIEIQERGDITHARQWARLARALSADTTMVRNQRGIAELEANIALVGGNAADVVAAVDELNADPLGLYTAGPRLVTLRGMALVELGDLADAAATLDVAFDARVDELFVDPSRIAGGLNNRAALARAQGDDYAAFVALEDAAALRAYLPADHPDRLTLERARLRFEAEVFGHADALPRAEQLATDTRRHFPAHHPDTIEALTLVADLALHFGDPGHARVLALDLTERVERNDLRGVLGARPYLLLAELDQDPSALAEALRRVGPVLPTAPVCQRIRAIAATLAAPPGTCVTAQTAPR